jgi:hypothetical protein
MAYNNDNIIVAAATLSVDGEDVGHTMEPVTIRKEREYYDVESQRVKGVIKKVKMSERLFVSTVLEEPTYEALQMAWDESATFGGNQSKETGSFYIGSEDTNEHSLTIVGEAPDSGTRTVTIYRAVQIDPSEVSFDKGEVSGVPVEFECLKDPDHTDGSGNSLFGEWKDT